MFTCLLGQAANRMAAIQFIPACGRGKDGSVEFKVAVRMREEREFK